MATRALRIGNVIILDHPHGRDRLNGAPRTASLLLISEGGKTTYEAPLSEDELVKLIARASSVLAVLRGVSV